MNATSPKSLRTQLLPWALALYAASTLVSMATMSIGLGILLASLLFSGRLMQWARELQVQLGQRVPKVFSLLALGLTLACILSLGVAALWPLSYAGHSPEVSFFRDSLKLWYLFWPLGLSALLRLLSEANRRRALQAWLLAFLALSVLGIIQHFTGWPRAQKIPGHEPYFHAILFLGHHLSVSSIFIFPFFACLDFASSRRRARELGLPQGLLIAACGLGLVTLFLTWSRTLWLSLPLGLLVWIFMSLKRRRACWVAGGLLLAVAGASQLPVIQLRLNDGIGSAPRFALWRANLAFLEKRPFTGVGWHHTEEMSGYYLQQLTGQKDVFAGHAHNNLLDLLGGAGVLGAFFWLAYCLFPWVVLFRVHQHPVSLNFARGLFCAWLVFQMNGLTQVNFWEGKVEHQLAWALGWAVFWAGDMRGKNHGKS